MLRVPSGEVSGSTPSEGDRPTAPRAKDAVERYFLAESQTSGVAFKERLRSSSILGTSLCTSSAHGKASMLLSVLWMAELRCLRKALIKCKAP